MSEIPGGLQTEITVLGAMLLDGGAVSEASGRLKPEDFAVESHQRIYRACLRMIERGRPLDQITVADELYRKRELDAVGGRDYLRHICDGIPRRPNIGSYVRMLLDGSRLRQLQGIFADGIAKCEDQGFEPTDILNEVESRMAALSEARRTRQLSDVGEIVRESFSNIDSLYEEGEVTGIRTGYREFDKLTKGLQKSELIVVAARPSMGKTAWCINVVQSCAIVDKKVVGVFSLEMSKESLMRRMLAAEAMVGLRKIQNGFCLREDRYKLITALDRLVASRIEIDDTGSLTVTEMRSKMRRLRKAHDGQLDLIVVDYLQLMTGEGGAKESRTQEVSAISRGLKGLAKEFAVPIVALSQLTRGSEERRGKRPILSDLRESGSIEQDADVVAFIHRPEYYEPENAEVKGKAEIILAKQRNGPTGKVDISYLAEYTKFEDLGDSY